MNLLSNLRLIIKENNIGGIIIGNPLNMDGSLGRSTQSVNDVATNISKSIRSTSNIMGRKTFNGWCL